MAILGVVSKLASKALRAAGIGLGRGQASKKLHGIAKASKPRVPSVASIKSRYGAKKPRKQGPYGFSGGLPVVTPTRPLQLSQRLRSFKKARLKSTAKRVGARAVDATIIGGGLYGAYRIMQMSKRDTGSYWDDTPYGTRGRRKKKGKK